MYIFSICRIFHFCVTAEALPLLLKNSIHATIWSEMLQYGPTYTMQTWSHIYDAIRCEPSDVSGYLIRTSGCQIWHDLTSLVKTKVQISAFIFTTYKISSLKPSCSVQPGLCQTWCETLRTGFLVMLLKSSF